MQIFTTLILTQDRLIVAGNVIQGTANSVLLWQTATTAASSAGAVSKQQTDLTAEDEDEVWHLKPFLSPASVSRGANCAGERPTCCVPSFHSSSARAAGVTLLPHHSKLQARPEL